MKLRFSFGAFHTRGASDVVNTTKQAELRVDVEDYGFDNIEGLDRLQERCQQWRSPGQVDSQDLAF